MQVNLLLMLHEDELRFCITLIKHVWFLLDQKQIHSYIKIITEKNCIFIPTATLSRVGNSLFCSSLFALLLFTLLLKISYFKYWLWGICSHRSLKKKKREQITLGALYKRATVSELLSLLLKKSNIFCMFLCMSYFPAFPLSYVQEWIAPIAIRSVALF